ncbi:hypothetical protein IEQ34_003782 [Dendrobium chrysotoxum]|uniref:Histone H4 n=1 Tax=Dendrobium chrysotoxum TaxID=161865 RepID=A0AAV7GYE1_DENCH|nr:hypothetical protein IEQ34_003782 [Dendrobium chrysotoxum]
MSGRGKGGKGLGKGGAKRHRKVLRDNIQGITKPAIRRLARRGGVKRISGLIYEETRGVLKIFLENVIRDAVTYTEHARRKTVTAMDVVYALKRQGRTLYGFGVFWYPFERDVYMRFPLLLYRCNYVACCVLQVFDEAWALTGIGVKTPISIRKCLISKAILKCHGNWICSPELLDPAPISHDHSISGLIRSNSRSRSGIHLHSEPTPPPLLQISVRFHDSLPDETIADATLHDHSPLPLLPPLSSHDPMPDSALEATERPFCEVSKTSQLPQLTHDSSPTPLTTDSHFRPDPVSVIVPSTRTTQPLHHDLVRTDHEARLDFGVGCVEEDGLLQPLDLCFYRCSSLIHIRMGENYINVSIPKGLFSLHNIVQVELNNLSGEIFEEIIGMRILNYLNLSRNHLDSSIPQSISLMQSLTAVDFSYNNLSGLVPVISQFINFNALILCKAGRIEENEESKLIVYAYSFVIVCLCNNDKAVAYGAVISILSGEGSNETKVIIPRLTSQPTNKLQIQNKKKLVYLLREVYKIVKRQKRPLDLKIGNTFANRLHLSSFLRSF